MEVECLVPSGLGRGAYPFDSALREDPTQTSVLDEVSARRAPLTHVSVWERGVAEGSRPGSRHVLCLRRGRRVPVSRVCGAPVPVDE